VGRKQSRETAFKMIFAMGFGNDPAEIELACEETIDAKELEFITKLTEETKNNLERIDEIISTTAKGFSFDRIYKVDLAALRLGVAEIMFVAETPDVVAVNEAVTLAKKYGNEKSGAYVNGILASVINLSSRPSEASGETPK